MLLKIKYEDFICFIEVIGLSEGTKEIFHIEKLKEKKPAIVCLLGGLGRLAPLPIVGVWALLKFKIS